MTEITNTRELPNDMLRCFAMTKEQAEKFATQYVAFWFYPLARIRLKKFGRKANLVTQYGCKGDSS